MKNRFEAKIDRNGPNGCWLWTSAHDGGRYGFFWMDGRNCLAHRVSFELYRGVIPDGMHVCHACDNGMCVNPAHLFLGTAKDNAQDRSRKGRNRNQNGERNNSAKLTEENINFIFQCRRDGLLQQDIATLVGVRRETIGKVLRRERWKHIKL